VNGREWTERELDTLRRLYPIQATRKVAKALGRPIYSVNYAAGKLGLHKTAEHMAETRRLEGGRLRLSGMSFRFQPGHAPVNKGVRQPGWSPGRMKETQFKKGNLSGHAAQIVRPIGTILADDEGFYRIKVREREPDNPKHAGWSKEIWPLLSHMVWEQHKGPIPPSHNIVFRDGDRANCSIGNLECVSRADMARRNAMWGRLPQELVEVITANGALKRKIRRLSHAK
jgi:hypothetical protein